MDNESKNPVSFEYLIDLISSIKSALHNLDTASSQNSEVISEISENLTVLTELYKRQLQDQKIQQVKIDGIIKSIIELQSSVNYIKERENQKELAIAIKNMKKEQIEVKISTEKNMFERIYKDIKNFSYGIGKLYKLMMVIFVGILIVLWLCGVITMADFKSIIGMRFF